MSNQQHLLLATDLSDTAKAAAVWAYTYAKATGAKVTLAHIVEISIPNWFKDAYSVTEDAARLAKHQDKIRAWYSDATGGAAADEVVVRVGQPYEQLREMVPELDIHMIVVSQSGKGAVEKILSGSLARSLVSVPPCAVVVVDPGHNTAFSHMEVTVATDLTDKAERALLFGAYITRLFHGQLDVVHASQLITAADLEADELPAHLQPEAIEAAARQQMDAVITRHADTLQKIEYASHVVLEHPVRAVQSFVGSKPQDLVILGTGDHTNIISNNFGRVSVKLMESLPCSVMVVPSTAQLTGKVD